MGRLGAGVAVNAMLPAIESTAARLLDAVAGQPEFDLIAALAFPLSANLARRRPNLRPAPDQPLTFHPNISFRGPQSLRVRAL